MGVDSNSVQFLLGLLLDVPVLSDYSFIPGAFAAVCLAKFVPFVVDGSHSSGIGLPELAWHGLSNKIVPSYQGIQLITFWMLFLAM